MFDLDKSTIDFKCPSCEFPNTATVREFRFGLTVLCRGCKRNIRLVPMDGGMTKAKQTINDFISEFKNINIRI